MAFDFSGAPPLRPTSLHGSTDPRVNTWLELDEGGKLTGHSGVIRSNRFVNERNGVQVLSSVEIDLASQNYIYCLAMLRFAFGVQHRMTKAEVKDTLRYFPSDDWEEINIEIASKMKLKHFSRVLGRMNG